MVLRRAVLKDGVGSLKMERLLDPGLRSRGSVLLRLEQTSSVQTRGE